MGGASPSVMSDPITAMSALDLVAALQRRELGAVEVMRAFLAQIDKLNPAVNAIVSLEPEHALKAAHAADQAYAENAEKALFGLPIAIKDLALTEGIRTTMGSPIYADFVPDRNDLFVERLIDNGAIVIGQDEHPGIWRRLTNV